MSAIENKSRFQKTMRQIPVTVILHKQPALLGLAAFALTDEI
jgi:glucokinase